MARSASGLRLFGWYVLASAIPISLLGLGLAHQSQTQMNRRALDQAASEADAIANAGIEPVLGSRELAKPLTHAERMKLAATTGPLLQSGSVLRLRLRDLKGAVVFDAAKPNQRPHGDPDEEVQEAARGEVVRKQTRLNADQVDAHSSEGPRAVEAYIPVNAVRDARVIGVLEIYLPYAPIAHSFAASNRAMTVLIMLGLILLWIALSANWLMVTPRAPSNAENEHMASRPAHGTPNRAVRRPRETRSRRPAGRANR
jgi:hypothetical protein